jgi:hypothetical protein
MNATEETAAEGERVDKSINLLRRVSVALAAVTLAVLLGLIPVILSARDNSQAVKDGSELASCRSQYSAEIVAPAQDRAAAVANRSVALVLRSNAAIVDGLAASTAGDDVALAQAIEEGEQAAVEGRALASEYAQASQELADARLEYSEVAVNRSLVDPGGFLRECRAKNAQ